MQGQRRWAIAHAVAARVGDPSFIGINFWNRASQLGPRPFPLSPSYWPKWPSILRLFAIVLCFVSFVGVEAAAAQTVGTVTRVQKQAQIGSTPAAEGTPVRMNDEIRTGIGARLQITFRDNTTLVLGENARVVVDKYVYNPASSTGTLLLNASTGALRFTTGQIGQMHNKNVTVNTPVAALSVRGTDFWAGIIDHQYGIVLLSKTGRVGVGTSLKSVTLSSPGQGTVFEPALKDSGAPSDPEYWSQDKINRALASVSFGLAFGASDAAIAAAIAAGAVVAITTATDEPRSK
jgi:FecR protein